jgi:UDP-glucose 4-epimerase
LKDKVVITGGAGFLGSHVADLLYPRARVMVFDNLSTGSTSNLGNSGAGLHLARADILDHRLLLAACRGASAVVHFAGLTSMAESFANPRGYAEVNALGSLRVLLAAKQRGVPTAILASSAAVYGNAPGFPMREDRVVEPISPYGASKVLAEQYFRDYNQRDLRTIILRFFNVYGPRQRMASQYAGVIRRFAQRLHARKPPIIYRTGDQTRDFLHVTDAARATLLALENGLGGHTYNIATGRATSILQLARIMSDLVGLDAEPEWQEARPGDVSHSRANTSLAHRELGFEPQVSLREGLDMTSRTLKKGG